MKKLWDFKNELSYLELEGQGQGIIMEVTRPLLLKVKWPITPNKSAGSVSTINQQSLVFYRWSIYKNSLNKISKRHIPHCWSVCWFELWLQFDLLWGKQAYKSRNSISFCHLVKSYRTVALIKLSARCITACTTNIFQKIPGL